MTRISRWLPTSKHANGYVSHTIQELCMNLQYAEAVPGEAAASKGTTCSGPPKFAGDLDRGVAPPRGLADVGRIGKTVTFRRTFLPANCFDARAAGLTASSVPTNQFFSRKSFPLAYRQPRLPGCV